MQLIGSFRCTETFRDAFKVISRCQRRQSHVQASKCQAVPFSTQGDTAAPPLLDPQKELWILISIYIHSMYIYMYIYTLDFHYASNIESIHSVWLGKKTLPKTVIYHHELFLWFTIRQKPTLQVLKKPKYRGLFHRAFIGWKGEKSGVRCGVGKNLWFFLWKRNSRKVV